MITATFEVRTHEDYGMVGLAMVGRHWFTPIEPGIVPHDMLEHFPNDDGSTEGELLALGASLFVRDGESWYGQVRPYGSRDPGYNMSGDIAEQARYMLDSNRSWTLRDPGRTTRLDDYMEEWLETACKHAMAEGISLWRQEPDEDGDDGVPNFLRQSEHWKIKGWLRKGYRMAQRRYRDQTSYNMLNLYMLAARKISEAFEHVEDYPDAGVRLTVSINVKRGTVSVRDNMEELHERY